jgi:hypothetical protein
MSFLETSFLSFHTQKKSLPVRIANPFRISQVMDAKTVNREGGNEGASKPPLKTSARQRVSLVFIFSSFFRSPVGLVFERLNPQSENQSDPFDNASSS